MRRHGDGLGGHKNTAHFPRPCNMDPRHNTKMTVLRPKTPVSQARTVHGCANGPQCVRTYFTVNPGRHVFAPIFFPLPGRRMKHQIATRIAGVEIWRHSGARDRCSPPVWEASFGCFFLWLPAFLPDIAHPPTEPVFAFVQAWRATGSSPSPSSLGSRDRT